MKKIWIIFIFILGLQIINVQVFGQNIPKSEMQQQIDELKQEVKNLEAELKLAEKSDPAEAASLKTELNALKSMLSMFDKSITPPASINQTKNASSQPAKVSAANLNKSFIVPITLKQPLTIPSSAQAKDKLLWYSGKKLNDSTLVTVKGSVIQFSKRKNLVIVQPLKRTDPYDSIVYQLSKGVQRNDEVIDFYDKMPNGFLYYPQIVKGIEICDDIEERFRKIFKNTIDLPVLAMPEVKTGNSSSGAGGKGPFVEYDKDEGFYEENDFQKTWALEMERAKKLFNELPPVSQFPSPPMHEFGMCSQCDKDFVKKQKIQDGIWESNYLGKEQEITQIVLGLERQKALLGSQDENQNSLDLIFSISKRMDEKNKILYERYGKDIRYSTVVLLVILGHERQKQLLGISDDNESSQILKLAVESLNKYEKYFDEQMGAKNHDFVLNIAQHLGIERQRALLGCVDDDGTDLSGLFNKLSNYNRFALTVDIDFIYEELNDDDELVFKATGDLSTKDKVYVMLYPDNCSYKMRLYDTISVDTKIEDISIPFTVKTGVKTIRDENNKLVTYSYSGPESYPLLFPDFKIEFCNNTIPDSAYFLTFAGDGQASNMGATGTNKFDKSYKVDFLGFANLVFQHNNSKKVGDNAVNLGADILTSIAGFQSMNSAGTKLDKLKMQYEGKTKMDNYRKNIQTMMTTEKSLFLFNANNRSTVLIDKFDDSKRKLDDHINLVRGMVHMRVVHDPLK